MTWWECSTGSRYCSSVLDDIHGVWYWRWFDWDRGVWQVDDDLCVRRYLVILRYNNRIRCHNFLDKGGILAVGHWAWIWRKWWCDGVCSVTLLYGKRKKRINSEISWIVLKIRLNLTYVSILFDSKSDVCQHWCLDGVGNHPPWSSQS